MKLKCALGSHNWQGCKCSRCGKARDEGHDWSKGCEKCAVCGATRTSAINWQGCKCSRCGRSRDEGHDWSKGCEKCAVCGATRTSAHNWQGCKCSRCSKTRNEGHDWSKDCENCVQCGATRASAHDWSKDCENCARCGATRASAHDWTKDCEKKCLRCGATQASVHDWSKDCENCARCGAALHLWAGKELASEKAKVLFATAENAANPYRIRRIPNLTNVGIVKVVQSWDVDTLRVLLSVPEYLGMKRGSYEWLHDVVNVLDQWGYTPLHYAAERGQAVAVSLLLANGAEVSAVSGGGTPLLLAADKGH